MKEIAAGEITSEGRWGQISNTVSVLSSGTREKRISPQNSPVGKTKQVIFATASFSESCTAGVLWGASPAPKHSLCNRTGREIWLLIDPALLGSEPAGARDGARKDIPRFLKASKIWEGLLWCYCWMQYPHLFEKCDGWNGNKRGWKPGGTSADVSSAAQQHKLGSGCWQAHKGQAIRSRSSLTQ